MNIKYILSSVLCMSTLIFTSCKEEHYVDGPAVDDAEMILQGKVDDDKSANMVYVDFSENKQYPISRRSWHLGLYCGNDFRVTLNQSLSRAYSTHKTDFAAVGLADAEAAPNLAAGMMGFGDITERICDDTTHDLEKTLFGDIESDESKSEVFLVATEELTQLETWFKVKVTRNGNGYKVEYGKIGDQTPKVKDIAKNKDLTFIGFSLDDGSMVELPKHWDIMWSSALAYNQMPNGKIIYGPASDVITVNRYENTEAAIVIMEEVCNFDKFSKEHLNQVEFHEEADVIGTTWRTTPMPGSTPGPKFDRFYVTRDAEGNCYKFAFLSFCEEDGGERGLPELLFTIVE